MLGHVNLGPGNGYCRGARDLPQPAALRKDLQMQVLQQELRVSMAGLSVEQCRVQFIIELDQLCCASTITVGIHSTADGTLQPNGASHVVSRADAAISSVLVLRTFDPACRADLMTEGRCKECLSCDDLTQPMWVMGILWRTRAAS